MKYIPILFSTPMVQALLEQRKTQTRRMIDKLSLCNHSIYEGAEWKDEPSDFICRNNEWYCRLCGNGVKSNGQGIKSKYNVGDILWVRETFYAYGFWVLVDGEWHFDDCTKQFQEQYLFEYCKPKLIEKGRCNGSLGWYKRPSIHMPKSACRIFLKVKSVRVERLQDISEEDAKAEGVKYVIDPYIGYCGLDYIHGGYNLMTTPYKGFRSLWKKINGEQSWESNPFVWVIEFERIELTPEQRNHFLNS